LPLQREMAANDSEKDYLAVVYGRVNVARGKIDLRLGTDLRKDAGAAPSTGAR